ncbi:MAG: uroporphyrinogen decarboxylase family protein [Verrucomicrobiota bacterium]
MTPKERAIAALSGKIPDRVPCVPLVDTSYAAACAKLPVSECFINPEAYAAALVATLDRHPDIDGVSINIGLSDDIILEHSRDNGAHRVKTVGGLTWIVPENDIGSIELCDITSFDDPRIATDEYLMMACLRTLRAIPQKYREKYLINTTVTGPFSQVAFLVGVNNIMIGTIDDEDALLRAIGQRVPFALKWVDALKDLDPGCIWIGEGFASNSLMGRESYRKFVMPFEKQVVDRIHEIGKTSILHICGKLDQSLESLLETGTDGAEIDWQVDIEQAKLRLGGRMTLKGNLNTSTLVKSKPDEVYALAREAILRGKPDGRFILSSGCCLGRDTPPENVDAIIRACEDFGAY